MVPIIPQEFWFTHHHHHPTGPSVIFFFFHPPSVHPYDGDHKREKKFSEMAFDYSCLEK
jgi:hypothetical protein